MTIDKKLREYLFTLCLKRKLGFNPQRLAISMRDIEHDKRKHKRIWRELTEGGYATGDGYATDKVFDEVEVEKPDLERYWAEQNRTRRRPLDYILFHLDHSDRFTLGERKWLVTDPSVRFYWIQQAITRYDFGPREGPGDLYGPFLTGEAIDSYHKALEAHRGNKQGRSDEFDLCVTTEELDRFVAATKWRERLDGAVKQNLPWGLMKMGLVDTEEEAKHFAASDPSGWPFDSETESLGPDGSKWAERFSERLTDIKEGVARLQAKLALMERLRERVVRMGGWDSVSKRYVELITEALKKQDEDDRKGEQ